MPAVLLQEIPEEIHSLSHAIERRGEGEGTLRAVNGLFGWQNHRGIQADNGSYLHHPCITSYQRLIADFSSEKVAAFHQAFPQNGLYVTLAGLPNGPSLKDAQSLLAEDIPNNDWIAGLEAMSVSGNAYYARPILALSMADNPELPLGAAQLEYGVHQDDAGKVHIRTKLIWIAIDSAWRGQGLGHLMALEAGRWCGLQTRNILLFDEVPHQIAQQATGLAASLMGSHLSTIFVANFASFSITEALVNKAKDLQEGCLVEAGSVMSGLATINGATR